MSRTLTSLACDRERTSFQGSRGRPSLYHRVPINSLTRDFRERPDQRLCFSSVGPGSGRFAPDAASQNSSQPVVEEESMSDPRSARPDLCSIRAVAGQAEPAGAGRGGFSPDGYPLGDDDPPAPPASGTDRAICLSTVAAVLAVAGIAAYVSYGHACAVIRAHGETGITALLEPATIVGLLRQLDADLVRGQ